MGAVIVSWETRFGDRSLFEHALRNVSADGDPTMPAEGVAAAPPVAVRVNQGRWIADCPDPNCTGAELVSFVRATFFCTACRNRAVANQPLPVAAVADRTDLEQALLARPDMATRNWSMPETVADLDAENELMGV